MPAQSMLLLFCVGFFIGLGSGCWALSQKGLARNLFRAQYIPAAATRCYFEEVAMSAKNASPSYFYTNIRSLDLEAAAPGIVSIITRLEQIYLEPFVAPDSRLDAEQLPEHIRRQQLLHEQYRLLCEQLGEYKCTLDAMLKSLCVSYFKYGYHFALENDDDAEELLRL